VALKEGTEDLNRAREEQITQPFLAQIGPVVFLALIFLLNFISRIIFSPLLPTIEKELGISHGQAGFFFFLISAGYLTGLLGSGFLSSRHPMRATLPLVLRFHSAI